MNDSANKVVLIVDDSASIRKEVKIILEKEGFTVREAGSEFGVFNSIDEYGRLVDIILMDLMLTDTYGFDLIEKIRKVDRFRNIPVIMLTQLSDRETVTMAKMLGVGGYLVKPIQPRILVEKVKTVLSQPRSVE